METLDIEKLTEAILQFNYYDNYIKEAKALIRKLPQKEVDKINEETTLHIDRQPQYNYTYSAEYNAEVEKLKEKYPAKVDKIDNYKIKLTTQNATAIRKVTEVRKLAENNITTLRRLSATVSKAKRK